MIKLFNRSLGALSAFIMFILFLPCYIFAGDVINVPSTGAMTIKAAMVKARPGDTIFVERGRYKEHVYVKNGVALIARAENFKAVIDGKGRGTVVTMGNNSTLSGFEVRNGTIGIFSKNDGVTISNCRISNNWQTGIITVRHLPTIKDNVIVFNKASGIQGWNVRSTRGSIVHNTIAYNSNHGLSIGGKSTIVATDNIIAFNERFGLKISDASKKSQITKNNFYKNLRHPVPTGNYSFDPAFVSPRIAMNFKLNSRLCCQIKASDNENLGARIK